MPTPIHFTREDAITNRSGNRNDIVRQLANVIGALFQVVAGALGFLVGLDIAGVSDSIRSLIVPADAAFIIWTPIFLLSIAYAVYQALPANREDPLLRTVGWFTAGAFFSNGIWELLFPNRQFLLAQLTILAIWLFLAAAFVRLVRHKDEITNAKAWLVALPIGLMFGWLTAANVAGLASTLVSFGLRAEGTNAAIGGAALLIFGGAVAATVIAFGKRGPLLGWVPYTIAVLWALAFIALNQREASTLTTVTALVVAVVLAGIALFLPPGLARIKARRAAWDMPAAGTG